MFQVLIHSPHLHHKHEGQSLLGYLTNLAYLSSEQLEKYLRNLLWNNLRLIARIDKLVYDVVKTYK